MHSPVWREEAAQSQEHTLGWDVSAQLSELTDELFRRALRTGDGIVAANGQVREALHRVCDVAHARGLLVEELLVLLKARWTRLPETRQVDCTDGQARLARVITLCIREFYDATGRER